MSALTAEDYAASMTASLAVWDATRPRSMQQALGVSSIGLCRAQALWTITNVTPTDAPEGKQALMGQAVHTVIGEARASYRPELLIEQKLTITLPSGVVLPGHADEIDPSEPAVTDYKTVVGGADMVALRRNGASEQQRFQRHLYYLGAAQAGIVPAQGTVRNVWIDRSGQSPDPFVEQEPFSAHMVQQADGWLSDVMYAAEHGEEVLRDKHYDWCKRFCQFFTHCRGDLEHPDLIVTDDELIQAAANAYEGRTLEKEGKALSEVGKRTLAVLQPAGSGDVQGYTCGEHRVRWSWVNSSTADRGGYFKLSVERVAA